MTLATAPTQSSQSAAGGADPEKFAPQEVWYPVHYLDDLDPKAPNAFTLLGQDLVIWWEPKPAHGERW